MTFSKRKATQMTITAGSGSPSAFYGGVTNGNKFDTLNAGQSVNRGVVTSNAATREQAPNATTETATISLNDLHEEAELTATTQRRNTRDLIFINTQEDIKKLPKVSASMWNRHNVDTNSTNSAYGVTQVKSTVN